MKRIGTTVLGLTALVAGTALAIVPAAGQSGTAGFSLLARADVAVIHPIASDAPLLPGGDVGTITPSSAQALVDSLGSSRAFASAPYGGEFIATLPGTVNGLGAGNLPPLPDLPIYVATEYPTTPTGSFGLGPYSIEATSEQRRARGDARIGLSTSGPLIVSANAEAEVVAGEDGVLTATATSSLTPLQIAPLVTLGQIRSSVTLTYDPADPGAGVQRASSLEIGTISVAGLTVGLTDEGLVVAGTTILPVDLSFVTELLARLGIGFTYLPATETATSVTSAALEVTYSTTIPALGDTTVTLTLGQVSATLDPRTPFEPTTPTTAPPTTTPVTAPPASSSGGRTVLPSTPATVPQPAPVTTAAPTPEEPVAAVSIPVVDLRRFYPVLIVAGLAALVVACPMPRRRGAVPAGGSA